MKQVRENIFYFISAAIMMIVLFAPGWAWNKFLFGLDTYTLHLPFLIYAKRMWAVFHDLPLWMPDIYMGMPAIDAANLIYFYPTDLLYIMSFMPVEQAYLVDLIIHMSVAGFGMFMFLKRHDIEKKAAYLGAFVYMFSGPLVTSAYNGHWPDIKAMALVPFVFYFIDRAIKEKKAFFYLSAGLFMGLQVMAIGMQVAAYTYIGGVIYAAYLLLSQKSWKKEIVTSAIFFAVMTVSVAVFSAPQFLPSQEYMNFSWRREFSYSEFTAFSFNPAESIVFLLPKFFGLKDSMYWGFFPGTAMSYYCGLLPFLLAAFALTAGRHRKISVFFLVLTVIYLIMSFGGFTPLFKLLYNLPVFNKFRNPAKVLCMMPFVFSFFAGAGFSSLMSKEDTIKTGKVFNTIVKTAATVCGLLVLAVINEKFLKGLVAGIYSKTRAAITSQPISSENLSYAAGFIRQDVLYFTLFCAGICVITYLMIRNRAKNAAVISLLFCFLQFFDMLRVNRNFISYESVKSISPDDPAAVYMKNDRTLFRMADLNFAWNINRPIFYGLESFIGFHAILHGKMYNLLGQETFKYKNIMRLFNVKYYVNISEPGEYKVLDLTKIVEAPVKLFEDVKVMPRVFLTDRVKKFSGDDEILAYMKTDVFDPLVALIKDDIILEQIADKLISHANISEYTPNRIKVITDANKDTILVLSNMYYHRWKVLVDKKPGKIYNIDYCINGVRLPAGKHEVEFYYDRMFVVVSIFLMFAVLAFYGAVYFTGKRRKTGA
jgi:hypothetical protein